MTKESRWLALLVVVAVAPGLQADQLKVCTAAVVDGTSVGRDQSTVRFQSADGVRGQCGVTDSSDLTFSLKASALHAAAQAPTPARAPQPVVVPAGAVLNVRLSQITLSTRDDAGNPLSVGRWRKQAP
jgi:hypothetical protein